MKAILVLDEMPECCADCPCSFFERGNPKLNLICGPTQEDANNVGKPDWCPLKEFPEEKNSEKKRIYDTSTDKSMGFDAILKHHARQFLSRF